MIPFRKSFTLLLFALTYLLSTNLYAVETKKTAPPEVIDRIVAVVNSDVITLSDLTDRTNLIAKQLQKQNIPLPDRKILMRQVLEKMIYDSVQKQYAEEMGLKVEDAQLDQAIERIAKSNHLTVEQFNKQVVSEGVPLKKFRQEISTEMLLAELRKREVDNKVQVSDNEVKAQLAQEKKLGANAQEEYDIAHIYVSVPENSTREQRDLSRKKIEKALNTIKSGVAFSQVAASYSDAPDALQGGNLGWRPAARLPVIFVEAVQKMHPGDTSNILETSNGFHLIQLLDVRGGATAKKITQYHVRQILIKINPGEEAQAKNKVYGIYDRLKAGEDFAKVASLSSEDDSRNNGGDIGWITAGETLPDFEKQLQLLHPGEISQPFETALGWHIVQLVSERESDTSLEGRMEAIKQGITARKTDELFDEWVRQLRDNAYVDIRLDDF
ncbi:MAG: peptidylprolyl isomerase [Betaproteobacteria bacterium]|uniref:peptidylprolyl isomerase n=1 Tax=Ferrovum sp. PN-J185 TaxID=1356306 RepID=UPI00079A3EEF|nr:peptidylprolyl isomerase [Ferrovum sp. PN-J185]KXW55503.1 chaperone SurA precursor [Ferrovum sp. PN-J185]MDE1891283.1 peptidylprolyl isomerase [Betaproteobacteria bacterium]